MTITITRFPNYTDMAAGIALKAHMPYLAALELVAERIRQKINATDGRAPLHLMRGLETVEAKMMEVKTW